MKGLFSILIFISLMLLGAQDTVSTGISDHASKDVQICSVDKQIKEIAVLLHYGLALDIDSNSNYTQILSKLFRDRDNTNKTFRLKNKLHTDKLLNEFNSRQRTIETTTWVQSITSTTLHNRFAHIIYEQRRIII